MYKLERVEISGFKSFYERVDLAFPGLVTAVVGPNGCGKSNICDAVAWALGEQSAKTLRGERMDDVIFNGSAKRRPLGMAEVILTLSRRAAAGGNGHGNGNGNGNGGGEAVETAETEDASEAQTLRIGRRVYREGEGEYFLNDKQVRLKDVQDRLLGTGLGVRAYSVIEQGRIDQVLSTKPQDRRRLIEEAAGITRYKLKKRLAEAKLEETRGNLLRISDILSEIERNVASLRRQASRAARYKERSQALREKRSALARARHDRLVSAVADSERATNERRDREAEHAAALGRGEAELAAARLAAAEASTERDRLRELVASLEASISRDDALLDGNRRAAADLLERRESLEREGREFSEERTRSARELALLDERLERAVQEARIRSHAREEADRKASDAASALTALEREVEEARAAALSATGERIAARNARHEAEIEASRTAASLAALEEARARVLRELSERREEIARQEEDRRRVSEEALAAGRDVAAWEAEIARLSREVDETEASRQAVREGLGAVEHRGAALREILRSRDRGPDAFRTVLDGAGLAHGGRLADRLRVRRGWEAAVDLVLGEDVDALLSVPDALAALEAARALPSAALVRSDWTAARPDGPRPSPPGWDAALENLSELSAAERAALPPTGFAAGLTEALELSREHPSLAIVTRDRYLVRGSLVRAANRAPEASGVFALRRELLELESQQSAARSSLSAIEGSFDELRRERLAREDEVRSRRETEREAGGRLSAAAARLEERREELARSERELATIEAESSALRQDASRLEERRRELGDEELKHASRETEIRQRADALAARLPEARSQATSAAEELSHRRTEAEVAAERRRSAEAAREKLLETGASLDRRLEESSEEGRRLSERASELEAEGAEARRRRAESLRAREVGSAELAAASEKAAETSFRVERAEEAARAERAALDLARESRFEAEVSHTRVRSDLDHLVEQATEEFGVSPAELPGLEDGSPEALEAIEREAAELALTIERMGPVNVLAYEEHEQESKRLEFLGAQRDDLVQSIAELTESIRKINATSSERFRQAFVAINDNFKAMFSRLFQGGTAEMRLLDENDPLESGVEIVAQPPGKRNQSILLLSGGEKALTAVALLMAIFRYKPSPFCILDEVDAPLDEANIDRFTRLLKDMTEETQFIAITHNKRTMETADVLYGVTMEEPGCSKIVSVKFD